MNLSKQGRINLTKRKFGHWRVLQIGLCSLVLTISLMSCDRFRKKSSPQEIDLEAVEQAVSDLVEKYDYPIKEMAKLHQIEYKVFSFPGAQVNSTLESLLNKAGEQRWDCFHVQQNPATPSELLFFCKRMPETPLRYLPKNLVGR